MATPIWSLNGSTNKVVECFLEPKSSTLYVVTVEYGNETFLNETYPTRASATTRVKDVRDRLLRTGDWTMGTTVTTDDPRAGDRGRHQ